MKTRIRGWNSWDSYGMYLDASAALREAEALARTLAPAGYRVFTVDMGWEGNKCPLSPHAKSTGGREIPLKMDAFGRYRPFPALWPRGFGPLAERLNASDLVFGLHLMRGVPRVAVERRLPVKDSDWRCDQIANPESFCEWNHWNYGLKPDHPGSADYLRSVFRLLRGWGVWYLKLDDITPHPGEIRMVRRVLDEVWPECVLSLSPGNETRPEDVDAYALADTVRVTGDVWDDREHLRATLDRVEEVLAWPHHAFIDLDMLPFGHLRVTTPEPENPEVDEPFEGWSRWSRLTRHEQEHMLVLRALTGSPLLMGGRLLDLSDETRSLLTDKRILACHTHARNPRVAESTPDFVRIDADDDRGGGWTGWFSRSVDPVIIPGNPLPSFGCRLTRIPQADRT